LRILGQLQNHFKTFGDGRRISQTRGAGTYQYVVDPLTGAALSFQTTEQDIRTLFEAHGSEPIGAVPRAELTWMRYWGSCSAQAAR